MKYSRSQILSTIKAGLPVDLLVDKGSYRGGGGGGGGGGAGQGHAVRGRMITTISFYKVLDTYF